jgi:hypothetical protein
MAFTGVTLLEVRYHSLASLYTSLPVASSSPAGIGDHTPSRHGQSGCITDSRRRIDLIPYIILNPISYNETDATITHRQPSSSLPRLLCRVSAPQPSCPCISSCLRMG